MNHFMKPHILRCVYMVEQCPTDKHCSHILEAGWRHNRWSNGSGSGNKLVPDPFPSFQHLTPSCFSCDMVTMFVPRTLINHVDAALAVHFASLCADKAAPTPSQWHGRLCCCPSDVPCLTTITSGSEVGVTLYSAKDAVGLVINSSCIYFTQDLLDLYVYLWKHYGSLDPHDLAAVEVCKSCILLTERILRAGLYNGQLLRGPHQALFSLEASDVMLNISQYSYLMYNLVVI